MNGKPLPPLELVKLCCRALDDKKAVDLRVLDVSEQSSITDYLVLATGTSDPHLRALRVELEKAIDASGTRILGMETVQDSGWIVVDAFDVMIHIFAAEPREHYGLENLWKDAVEVSVPKLLAAPKAAKPRKTAPAKKAAPAKKPAPKKKPAKTKTKR
jgi:ribosome-associated protein